MGRLILCIIICIASYVIIQKTIHNELESGTLAIIGISFILIFAVFLTSTMFTMLEILGSKNDTKLKDEYAILVETLNSYNENTVLEIEVVERVRKFNEDYLEYAENVENENFWTIGLYSKEAIEGLDVIHIEDYRN